MKRFKLVAIIGAVLATPHFVVQAYQERGYFAPGGEWLITPLVLLAFVLCKQLILLLKEASKYEGGKYEEEK